MKPPKLLHRKVRIVSPYPITHRFKVADDLIGCTLLEMMAIRFPFRDKTVWESKINEGLIGVNETRSYPDYLLKQTDQIFHHNPAVIEPGVPDEVEILQQTENYLIAYKPAPMPMHPGGRYNKNSLTHILADQGFKDLKVVHRLDGVTSGLVLLAKNKPFSKEAMLCFSEGKVKKTYYALVAGQPDEDEITIDAPIRRKTGFVFESGYTENESGLKPAKKALTHFEVAERGKKLSIIKCTPKTGRTHQIRLHLERWGFPIWDDPIYGPHGDKSSKRAQNIAIGLLNAGLKIEELGVNYTLDIPDSWKNWIRDEEFSISNPVFL